MNKIELKNLKDYSITKSFEHSKLYKKLNEVNPILLNTSICEVVGSKKKDEPILEIKKSLEDNEIIITTFGYVGRFSYFGVDFNIGYRFGDTVLNRMISKVNDFEIKSLSFDAENSKKQVNNNSLAMKILYMNFIFKLEKLSVIGLPKNYLRIEHHDNKLKGQVDINRFIKKDMPFQGKISSISYEQVYVQEILDVLYGALIIVESNMSKLAGDRLFQVRNLIYHHANKRFVDERTIENAIYHKSIQNSLYGDFKQTLEISSYIIRYNNQLEYKANNIFSGLIFDVSLLWENYLYRLLKESLDDDGWQVLHEDEISVYEGKFYERNMYPDIVIKNEEEKKVIVLDAKSKSMEFDGRNNFGAGDLDRNDFFQINTYMTYYEKQGYKVIAGGLLYPIQKDYETNKNLCNSENWFGGNNNTQFIVDGIDLSKLDKEDFNIIDSEQNFIERIKNLITNQT